MTRTILAACALLLAACAAKPVIPKPPEPVDAKCAAECGQDCDYSLTWAPTDPDSPEAWAELIEQVVIPMRSQVRQCEIGRRACVQCLDRLRRAGVIR